jgi:hypothetical protein
MRFNSGVMVVIGMMVAGGGRPAYAGTGAALSQDGLIVCDASTNSRRPYEVYNTPIIVTDQADSKNRVALWTERNVANVDRSVSSGGLRSSRGSGHRGGLWPNR